jgi:hypothetical protein
MVSPGLAGFLVWRFWISFSSAFLFAPASTYQGLRSGPGGNQDADWKTESVCDFIGRTFKSCVL